MTHEDVDGARVAFDQAGRNRGWRSGGESAAPPRRACPHSGKVMCKRLPATHGAEFERQEARYRAQLVQQPRSGEVELF